MKTLENLKAAVKKFKDENCLIADGCGRLKVIYEDIYKMGAYREIKPEVFEAKFLEYCGLKDTSFLRYPEFKRFDKIQINSLNEVFINGSDEGFDLTIGEIDSAVEKAKEIPVIKFLDECSISNKVSRKLK